MQCSTPCARGGQGNLIIKYKYFLLYNYQFLSSINTRKILIIILSIIIILIFSSLSKEEKNYNYITYLYNIVLLIRKY